MVAYSYDIANLWYSKVNILKKIEKKIEKKLKKLLKVNVRKKIPRWTTLSTCVWKFKENNAPAERESVTEKNSISEMFDIPK